MIRLGLFLVALLLALHTSSVLGQPKVEDLERPFSE